MAKWNIATATKMLAGGRSPVALHPQTKEPIHKAWQNRLLTDADIVAEFSGEENIGMHLGAKSDGLADIDVDSPTAVRLATFFLPKTGALFGRASKRRSHYLYTVTGDLTTTQFRAIGGAMIVEIRWNGAQTMVPPSIHPSGEKVEWDLDGVPATITSSELRSAVACLAAFSLLADAWPDKGSRNDAALALAGGLIRAGRDVAKVEEVLEAVADAAGDEEATLRVAVVAATAKKIANGDKATGWPRLAEIVGKEVVERVRGWLGVDKGGTSPASGTVTQASRLVDLLGDAHLFHDRDLVPFATMKVNGHAETHQIGTLQFRDLLSYRYYKTNGGVPSGKSLQEALNVLRGKAKFDAPEELVFVRFGEHDDGIYLDLGDATWRAVMITAVGWEVDSDPPVRFRRPKTARALPLPEHGGDISSLRQFLNLAHDDDLALLVGFLLCTLRVGIQYPVLILNGVQGSAKSTLARIIKHLVDPSSSPLSTEPRDVGDLLVAAKHTGVLAIDNLSYIPNWLSDALCRLSTGGGLTKRQLYTDDEPITIDVQRPVILTGIGEIATRGDLLDRSIVLNLSAISADHRRDETQFWMEFEAAVPKLLGALLDAAVAGLARLPSTKLDSMPRMAAAARWVTACEPALPWAQGTFLKALTENHRTSNSIILETSPIYDTLAAAVTSAPYSGVFDGKFAELLGLLRIKADEKVVRQKGWPTTPHHLSNALKRIEPSLSEEGWSVERDTSKRTVRIVALSGRSSEVVTLPSLKTDASEPEF